jgi:hypothetical protein
MHKLNLADGLTADLTRLVDSRMLVAANSGGGKSYLLRLLAEQAAGKVQVVILDPEGEFASLREKFDFLLVGAGGEVPAEPRAAGLLARRIMELQASAVIDLGDLKLGERRRFVRSFLESLMALPKALWRPLIVMIDEAHLFCPERSSGEAESSDAVIALMSQGRKRGYCGVLATQRLSKLHKDAEAEANNVFVGRCWLDLDQKRAGALLGMDAADRQQLRENRPGEFLAFGPALSTDGVTRFKANAVETTHPKAGHRHKLTPPKPSDAVRRLLKDLEDLPQQAEAEVRDLTAAKAEIARLTKGLAKKPAAPIDKAGHAGAVRQVKALRAALEQAMKVAAKINAHGFDAAGIDPAMVEKAVRSAADQIVKAAEAKLAARKAEFDRLRKEAGQVLERLQKLLANEDLSVEVDVRHNEPFTVAPAAPPKATRAPDQPPADGLTGPQQEILDTVLMLEARGIPATRDSVARWIGIHPNGGSYGTNLGFLRSNGYLEGFRLTDAGRTAARPKETGLDAALAALPDEPKRNIVRAVFDAGSSGLTRDELAGRLGLHPNGGSYGTNLGWLRTMGLITPRGAIQATEGLTR